MLHLFCTSLRGFLLVTFFLLKLDCFYCVDGRGLDEFRPEGAGICLEQERFLNQIGAAVHHFSHVISELLLCNLDRMFPELLEDQVLSLIDVARYLLLEAQNLSATLFDLLQHLLALRAALKRQVLVDLLPEVRCKLRIILKNLVQHLSREHDLPADEVGCALKPPLCLFADLDLRLISYLILDRLPTDIDAFDNDLGPTADHFLR